MAVNGIVVLYVQDEQRGASWSSVQEGHFLLQHGGDVFHRNAAFAPIWNVALSPLAMVNV